MQCPGCSAEVAASAASCGSCGKALPSATAVATTSGQTGWGGDFQSYSCPGCGAQLVQTSTGQASMTCAFCGGTVQVQAKVPPPAAAAPPVAGAPAAPPMATDTTVRPDFVIPFKIQKEQSTEVFRKWVSSRWFAPGDLKTQANAGPIRGVYLPFWTYDVETSTWYDARVGFDYKVKESVTETNAQGQSVQVMKDVTKTRWENAWGWNHSVYDDVLVLASKGIDRETSVSLEPFPMVERQPYSPEHLKGWEAERYSIDADMGWKQFGRDRVMPREKDKCEQKCRKERKADKVENLNLDTRFSRIASKLILLPIFISAYQYKGKTYKFMINGQTSKVVGDRPYSAGKIAILILVILLLLGGGIAIMPKGSGKTTPVDTMTADTWNTKDNAKTIGVGDKVKGYAAKNRNRRELTSGSWYVVTIPDENATVQLIHAMGGGADIDIDVLDTNGKWIDHEIGVSGVENLWLGKPELPGRIFIRVYYYSGKSDLFQYELQVVKGHQAALRPPE